MRYATKIDWAHQEVHDLMKVAGITIKKEIFTYTTPLKLTIKEVPMKQGLASRGSTSIIYFTKYRGYLVTAGGLHLILEYKSKAKVTRLMKELSEQMKLELELKDVEVL